MPLRPPKRLSQILMVSACGEEINARVGTASVVRLHGPQPRGWGYREKEYVSLTTNHCSRSCSGFSAARLAKRVPVLYTTMRSLSGR